MSIPRKKSRPITVDDQKFRWLFKGSRRRFHDAYPAGTVTIQIDCACPGQILQVDVVSHRPGGPTAEEGWAPHKASLTPVDIERLIKAAKSEGWDPCQIVPQPFKLSKPLVFQDYEVVI